MGNPHNWKFTKAVYEQNFFMLHYILSPDCGTEHLSPIQVDSVKLQIELSKPLSKLYICIIMTDTPRVIEVSKDRNIEIRRDTISVYEFTLSQVAILKEYLHVINWSGNVNA